MILEKIVDSTNEDIEKRINTAFWGMIGIIIVMGVFFFINGLIAIILLLLVIFDGVLIAILMQQRNFNKLLKKLGR